jgi:hypothetical protein
MAATNPISFVKVSVEMARPAVVILAGGGSRKYARAQNPSLEIPRAAVEELLRHRQVDRPRKALLL